MTNLWTFCLTWFYLLSGEINLEADADSLHLQIQTFVHSYGLYDQIIDRKGNSMGAMGRMPGESQVQD